ARAFARLDALAAAERNRIRWTYGFAVAARLPDKAQQAFDLVLQEDPKVAEAWYGCGMLLEHNRPEEALTCFNRAIQESANFIEPRRARAIVLARRGSVPAASQDINWCLDREPGSGVVLYGAACVTALAAAAEPQSAEH